LPIWQIDDPIRVQLVEIIEPFISSLCGVKDHNEYVFHGVGVILFSIFLLLRRFPKIVL